uniref:Prenyltransferase GME11375 n=1 Tax=Pestalotiopsis microspora TaxID=85828 RepID=GME75_PESMI|nr:RecName: Full=Prenyltransferase GME11375; AltName: Full=Dibenzodioxocinones biosynthesis cluster protein GME11375 [Pestalotiopsis microspora]QED41506.1 aromatic prenyltransferase [Pestalotiopsis microspora]
MNGQKDVVQVSEAWQTLSTYLPPVTADRDYWWQLTGRHVAALVEAAGYPIEKQYEALIFHYHWTVPYMGPAPKADGTPATWKSLLGLDGSPIEYSWKWNTTRSEPDVRYVTEPIGQHPGSHLDPLNQHALRELLQRFSKNMPSSDMNMSWVNHFFARLYDHDNTRYIQEAAAGSSRSTATSVQLGTEFLRRGIGFKTYFFPRKLGQVDDISISQYGASMSQLDVDETSWDARKALVEFLETNPEGKSLRPFSLAVDNVAPSQSRLKWYFHTLHTSIDSVREIMTLGGRINGIDKQLEELEDLIRVVAGLASDFPTNAEIPLPKKSDVYDQSAKDNFGELEDVLTGYLYYFDIAPGQGKLPEVKWFIPSRHYGPNDRELASALGAWMEARGRGAYNEPYMKMLHTLSAHRGLGDGKGLQTFISCLFKPSGDLDITTYLGAEAFHPGRVAKMAKPNGRSPRATLRRGDD